MCGRYYIDSDMADEIEKVVHDIDQRIRQEHFAGDIFPTNVAPIIEKSEHGLKLDVCKWGYPLSQGKNLVINARAESVPFSCHQTNLSVALFPISAAYDHVLLS